MPVRPSDQIAADRAVRKWAKSDCEGQIRMCLDLIVDAAISGCCLSYNHAFAVYIAFVSADFSTSALAQLCLVRRQSTDPNFTVGRVVRLRCS